MSECLDHNSEDSVGIRQLGDDEPTVVFSNRSLKRNAWRTCCVFFSLCVCSLITFCISRQAAADDLHPQPAAALHPKRFAYVWYLSDTAYECAIAVAADTVQKLSSRVDVDFVVLHNIRVQHPTRFDALHIRLKRVKTPSFRGRGGYGPSFTKLWASHLFEYDRVIYFDVDAFVLNSLDPLFDVALFPIEIAAPRAYWLPQPFAQSGGPVVLSPRPEFYARDFKQVLDAPPEALKPQYSGEMDWVNEYFRDRIDLLDGFYALLIGEWCDDDAISQYWQKHFGVNASTLMEMAPMVHFIASWKPWQITDTAHLAQQCKNAQPEMAQVYQKWWDSKARICESGLL